MSDFVAYHSTERMGRPFNPTENFSFLSRKSEKTLESAVGQRVWTIVGERVAGRQTYRLAGMFEPTEVQPHQDDWFRITGPGVPLNPQPELTDLEWFRELFREQNQFSFGFNRIRNPSTIAELDQLLLQRKTKKRSVTSGPPVASPQTRDKSPLAALAEAAETAERRGDFDVTDLDDARHRVLAAIVRRQGQPAFRKTLLRIYGGRCAFSGCTVTAVLDAAHILPYKGPATNHPQNGLLLRTDLHTLFDLGLLTVDTRNMTIVTAPGLEGTDYADLAGQKVRIPKDQKVAPSLDALDAHRRRAV